jgi:hypothetical protein
MQQMSVKSSIILVKKVDCNINFDCEWCMVCGLQDDVLDETWAIKKGYRINGPYILSSSWIQH